MPQMLQKNAYRVIFRNNNEQDVVADSVLTLAKQLDGAANPITAVKEVKQAVSVIETDMVNPVDFTTTVTPSPAAGTAGCAATPTAFTVEAGTPVIFQATVGTGYSFVGWFINGTIVSADQIASIPIPVPAISGQSIQIEARFVATP
jgi:hypothetical protein